ncbi:formin 1, putative [Plasmodium ovale wallikeri]|uniref:Formin 1, putative n=1 Tax=Plasmodium ovale wallikeri TaxID=864142 RepID=A0A1A8YW64_PLAOA|nr:formin 1, putative [Plasmodium ovale wallikeri]SBT36324.1 formin 1, putative [Plasmodium ovale wallikeri]
MEKKKITLATINDIENDKNVDTLSMITKIDLKLNNSKNEKNGKIKSINFEDSVRMNDEQIKVKEAIFILQNMEIFNYSISYTEIQNIRNDLRLFAINNYYHKKYSDCLIQVIHSYMIAKKYYSKYFGFYINGDMSTELILICKCFALVEKYTEGLNYLKELKFLIDNTLLYTHKKGTFNEKGDKKDNQASRDSRDSHDSHANRDSQANQTNKDGETNESKNIDSNYQEPVILCGMEVLSNILYIFSDLLSLYKLNGEAESYFLKYLYIIEKCFTDDSLNYSDALNDVCSYYIKIREYTKALPICEKILEIRKKYFGDYNAENPSEIIADCYCNWGLLLRLSGNSLESLHKYLIAVDMRMRIHKTRQTIEVQNILFSFAIIMHQLNNFKMSLQLYKEVYAFYKNYYGPEDMNTIIVYKLIEDLEADVMKEADKRKKGYQDSNYNTIAEDNINDNCVLHSGDEHTYNLQNYMPNINNKLRKDGKIKQNWDNFDEKIRNISIKSDVDPNLIENLMNERVLINPKNISHINISDRKKKYISIEQNFKYNNLNYSSIDAYKHMQSNKEYEILKGSFFPISSINRIKSLYADTWKNTLIPSTYILPFVDTKLVDTNLIKFSECKDFQNAIIYKRKILPIVNIPLIERGYVQLQNDQPIMICNEDAKILLSEWNVKEPFVDTKGKVVSKYEDLDNEFNMFIPILDENNEVILGFYNTPLLVPNPAIYHCIILGDPYYFHRYNQVNNLYSFDNLNIYKNKKGNTKQLPRRSLIQNLSKISNEDDSSDSNRERKETKGSKSAIDSSITIHSLKSVEKTNVKDIRIIKKDPSLSLEALNKRKANEIPKEEEPPTPSEKSDAQSKKNTVEPHQRGDKDKKNAYTDEVLKDEQKDPPNDAQKEPPKDEQKDPPKDEQKEPPKDEQKEPPKDEQKDPPKDELKVPPNDAQKVPPNDAQKDPPKEAQKEPLKKQTFKGIFSSGKTQALFDQGKMGDNKKIQTKKVHVLKGNRNSSSTLFSKEKYAVKKANKMSTSFTRPNEKIKLIGYSNSSKIDKVERPGRKIKLKKEPILKSAIVYNIKMDLQNSTSNISHGEQCDVDNLRREMYYEDFASNCTTHSSNTSFKDEQETVASYREYDKGKKGTSSSNKRTKDNRGHKMKEKLGRGKKAKMDGSQHGIASSSEDASGREWKDPDVQRNGDEESDNEDVIDICKILDTRLPYGSFASHDVSLSSLTGEKYDQEKGSFDYITQCTSGARSDQQSITRSSQGRSIPSSRKKKTSAKFTEYYEGDIIGENWVEEREASEKGANRSDPPNGSSYNRFRKNEIHIKEKINNIKNVDKSDIMFKFSFSQEGSKKSKKNIVSYSDMTEREVLEEPLINKGNLDGKTKLTNSLKQSTYISEGNFFFSYDKKEITKNALSSVKENTEEYFLSENEEFYQEVLLKEGVSNGDVVGTNEVETGSVSQVRAGFTQMGCKSAHSSTSGIGMNPSVDSKRWNDFHCSSEKICNLDDSSNHLIGSCRGSTLDQMSEESSCRESCKSEKANDVKKDNFTDSLFLRSNSIEELDSNLITHKYEANYRRRKCKKDKSGKNSSNKSNSLRKGNLDDMHTGSWCNIERSEVNSDDATASHAGEEHSVMESSSSGTRLSWGNKVNIFSRRDSKINLKNEKENVKSKDKNMDEHEGKNSAEYRSPFRSSGAPNDYSVYDEDDDFAPVVDVNINSTFNDVHGEKKKKDKISSLLPSNRKTRIFNFFSFFSKKKEKNVITSKSQFIFNHNVELNKDVEDAYLLNDPFSGVFREDENVPKGERQARGSKKEQGKKDEGEKDEGEKDERKKKKFIPESLHGMDKPKLNLKSKILDLKKKTFIKKGILGKKSFLSKGETSPGVNDIAVVGEKDNPPLSRKQSIGDSGIHKKEEAPVEKQPSGDYANESGGGGGSGGDGSRGGEGSGGDGNGGENNLAKKIGSGNVPKKIIVVKKIVPKIIPKIVVNKTSNGKDKNVVKKLNDTGASKCEVKMVKNISDKLSFDVLRKVKFCKIGFEPDDTLGTLPTVHLLNENKIVIATVPWQLDLTSFSLAKCSVEEETIKKIGLMRREFDISVEDRKKLLENETKLLTGEGLKELGFSGSPSTSSYFPSYTPPSVNLITGIDINALKDSYKIEKKSVVEEKKESIIKKEASKKSTPKEKGGKKGAPKFMKGPPKGVKGGPVVGKGKLTKIKQVKDEGKTKRFFWEALFEDDVPGTLFEDKKELINKIEIEKESVEKCFAKIVNKKEQGTELKIKKPKIIQLLPDSKREYNMSIALAKFNNYTFKEIRDAIMDLNPDILNIDNTEVLMQYVPTGEEFEIVKEYIYSNGDLNLVDKPEQYVAALMGVPLLKQRLESHYFALSFKENYENTLNPLEHILESCEAVKNSTKLFTILFTILNVGNTLNYGDPQRGNAFGFKLTTLAKLNDIRSSTKPVKTLLQYICEIIYEKSIDTLDIIEELRCIDKVVKTDKQIIDSLLQKLKLGSTKIKNVLELAKKNPEDPLYDTLKEFYFSVEPKIEELENFYNQTFAVFKEIALYLGYKEKEIGAIQVQDFFKELWKFIQSIEFNRKTINEAAIKEQKKKEKELANQKKGAILAKKQNFTISKKKEEDAPKPKMLKKTFKIF